MLYKVAPIDERYGHDMFELTSAFRDTPIEKGKPSLLIARTVKGKGVSFMEDKAAWHHKVPTTEQMQQALDELNLKLEEI